LSGGRVVLDHEARLLDQRLADAQLLAEFDAAPPVQVPVCGHLLLAFLPRAAVLDVDHSPRLGRGDGAQPFALCFFPSMGRSCTRC
jgi:hypothetical protein